MGVRLSYREDASGLEWERELGGGVVGCVCVCIHVQIYTCMYILYMFFIHGKQINMFL